MSTVLKQKVIDRLVKKGGLRACVDAHCCQCIYDDLVPGTWRKQVENCTVEVCALYHKRPKPGSKGGDSNGESQR
jgi:hypothetical protein